MTMPRIEGCMDPVTHAVRAGDDLYEVVRMLITESVTGAPVVDESGRVVGMLTEGDCLRLLSKGSGGDVPRGTVREFMSESNVTVSPEMDIYYAAGLFNGKPERRRFAVVDGDDKLVAVVTRKDILKLVHRELMRSPSVVPPAD